MTEIFLAYAPRDQKNAEFVADGLRAAGYVIKDGFTPGGGTKPLEDMALDVKRAAAVLPLLTEDSEKADAFIEQLRAALLYEKPHLYAVRLEPGVEVSAFAERRELLRDTVYENDPDGLVKILEDAVDLSGGRASIRRSGKNDKSAARSRFGRRNAKNDEADTAGEKIEPRIADAGLSDGPAAIAPLLDLLKKNKITPKKLSAEQISVGDNVELDSLGLPKTSDAMVAHWRLIQESGSVADIRRFARDYEVDHYFTTQARELEAGLMRKRYWRGALIGLDGAIGMLVAGVIGYGVLGYCADGSCANLAALPTARASVAVTDPGAAAELREAQRQVDSWRGRAQAKDREIATLRTNLRSETDRVIALERRLGDAESTIASLRRGGVSTPAPVPAPRGASVSPQLEADLAAAQRNAQSARDELQRAELRLRDQTSQLAELRRQIEQRDAEISRLRNQPARVVERTVPQPTPEQRQAAPAFSPSTPRPAPAQASGGLAGAERILIFYRDQLQGAAEDGRRRPALGGDDLRKLQACILRYTGALAKTDGVWGIETTSALFTIDVEEANWIIDCLRQRG